MTPIFYDCEHQSKCYIQLSCTCEAVKNSNWILQQIYRVRSVLSKRKDSLSHFLHLTDHQEVLADF